MRTRSGGVVRALVLVLLAVLVGCSSNSSSTNAGTGFLLVSSQGNSSIASYQINLNTGLLTQQGGEVTTGTGSMPVAILLTPAGDAAFVANRQTNDIARYTLNSDGTFTAVTPNQPTSSNAPGLAVAPVSMATDSGGKFLFVANQSSDTISVFAISGTGLTEVAGSPFVTGANPTGVAVAPNSNFVYVTNDVNGTVSGYTFDSASGAITGIVPGSPYIVGASPSALAFATPQNGNAQAMTFLYVTNFASNNVSGFVTCVAASAECLAADGSLVSVGAPISAGLGPTAAAVTSVDAVTNDPTTATDYLYVVDRSSDQISEYKIAAGTGVLTALAPASVSTGVNPAGIGITADGSYLYVPNQGASTFSAFHIAPTTGVLGPVQMTLTTPPLPSAVGVR
jgi:6-phosphogluconolactonase